MAGHDDIVGVNAGPYYAQVMGVDGEFLHCELVANKFLSTEWHLDSSQEQALQDRGWALGVPSAGPNWSQEVPRAGAPWSVAAEILSALREVYRVDVKHLQPHGPTP